MKFGNFDKIIQSPKAYQLGFQLAQEEYERFLEIKNRLNQIKAYQQLKRGELFLEAIEVNSPAEISEQMYRNFPLQS